jgi:uncharacterized membrane protein YuzA (DUF378 family)
MQRLIHKLSFLILIIGGLSWIPLVFNYNLIDIISKRYNINPNIIYLIFGFVSLYIVTKREHHSPHSSETILPCSVLNKNSPKKADLHIILKCSPNKKIIYWADKPKKLCEDNENSGVTFSDNNGVATIKIMTPNTPHFHYRECDNRGLLSEIKIYNL